MSGSSCRTGTSTSGARVVGDPFGVSSQRLVLEAGNRIAGAMPYAAPDGPPEGLGTVRGEIWYVASVGFNARFCLAAIESEAAVFDDLGGSLSTGPIHGDGEGVKCGTVEVFALEVEGENREEEEEEEDGLL